MSPASFPESKTDFLMNQLNQLNHQDFSLKEAIGLNEEVAKKLYHKAYQLYQAGKYAEASQLFATLMMFDSRQLAFLFGLAGCYFMLHNYDLAAHLYMQCGALEPFNPIPFYYAATCYWKDQDRPSAIAALSIVVKKADNQPQYQEVKERAVLILESMSQLNKE